MSVVGRIMLDPNAIVEVSESFWLMETHKWAYYAWQASARRRDAGMRYSLVHADYHFDGCNDFHEREDIAWLRSQPSLEDIELLIRQDSLIRFDSFIAPAIISRFLKEAHFFCLQDDVEPGLHNASLKGCGCRQHFYHSAAELRCATIAPPIIFDLDLDLFNRSEFEEEADLWRDEEILDCLSMLRPVIDAATIVTVALSTKCCGEPSDASHLAALVLPKLCEFRGLPPVA